MKTVVDLTHPFVPGMPVYPGTQPPTFLPGNTVERDGFAERRISFHSHTGTHIDAPAHMIANAPTLDDLPVNHFVGMACVVAAGSPGEGPSVIGLDDLESKRTLLDGAEFVLLHTGWSRFWGQARYLDGFPVLSPEAARWLAAREIKGVGVDAISVDPVGAAVFHNHLELFRAGCITIENLTGLADLVGRRFLFACLPLKLEAGDGSPVRAVAILD